MAAAVAFYPDKAMLQATATQVVLELVDDEARQTRIARTAFFKVLSDWRAQNQSSGLELEYESNA